MKITKNNKGVTLIIVLVLSAVALVIVAGLLYMITEGTKISGSTKRYKTALEAAKAGTDVVVQVINNSAGGATASIGPLVINTSNVNRLFNTVVGKLNIPTSQWAAQGYDTSINIDTTNANLYDLWFDLGGGGDPLNPAPVYRVYAKVTDTAPGNSSRNKSVIHAGGTVNARAGGKGPGEISAPSYPFLYTIEILAQNSANPLERAKLSVLYQY
jgi:hypothetical protein